MQASSLALAVSLSLAVALAGCGKTEGGSSAATAQSAVAVPGEAPTIAITGTPASSAAPAASGAPAPSSVASAAPAAASASAAASAKAAASSKAASAASASAASASGAPSSVPALRPAATRVSGKNFTLDVASPGCRVDTPCAVTLRLAASGEYHVNKEFPYKFTATAAPGVQFLGNGDANTFSRSAGDFREDGEKAATLSVRFKPTAAGEALVAGTYKMSVCSAEKCQVESQPISLSVPVL
jgi:hypothetical protein